MLRVMQLVLISGLSGSGKSVALHLLEDAGYYCVDNLPVIMLTARADRSVNLDVGETILISEWSSDGTTQVKYRGASWTAIHRPGVTPATGMHKVVELVGNRLLVEPL